MKAALKTKRKKNNFIVSCENKQIILVIINVVMK